ncbi:MAG: hypothetical protein ACXWV0_07255 [Flavisolibacter sp.]
MLSRLTILESRFIFTIMRFPGFVLSFFFIFQLASCKTVDLLKMMQAEEAELYQFTHKNKTVSFIPMHHLGKASFYEDVKVVVSHFKKEGYIVYYESARMDVLDSVEEDLYNRKFRKMMGTHIDSSGYAATFHAKGLFKNLVDQPSYPELGVDSLDKRVDISKNELVDIYEKRYGPVPLDSADLKIPLDASYPMSKRLPQNQLFNIILDVRNHYLAKAIREAEDPKILVIYGRMHLDGTFDELAKMEKGWKKKKMRIVDTKK